jgi:hypothetical protein
MAFPKLIEQNEFSLKQYGAENTLMKNKKILKLKD